MKENSEEIFAKVLHNSKMTSLGEVSAGLVHELNNPLTVIQGRCFQLQHLLEQNKLDAKSVLDISASILSAAGKISSITKAMKDFGRSPTNENLEIICLADLIDETLDFCRTRFHNHGIQISVAEIPVEFEVKAQKIPLQHAFLHLLNNAFDSIKMQNESESKSIKIHILEKDANLELHIYDSGPKIPATDEQNIFQNFYTTKPERAGIGLKVCQKIIQEFGGEVSLNQNPEKEFIIRLKRF